MDASQQEAESMALRVVPLSPGTVFGERYKVLEQLPATGVEQCYTALDVSCGRTVTLKLICGTESLDRRRLQLFEHNAHLNLMHPALVVVYACGLSDSGQAWVATECLAGATLAEILGKEGALAEETACNVVLQLLRVLAYLHGRSEVHMNVKPGKLILITDNSGGCFIKLADSGIGQLLLELELAAADERAPAPESVFYMSPEQLKGDPMDARSDLYAAGCILYHCLVGRPPHEGRDLLDTMDRHLRAPVTFPSECSLSAAMQSVIAHALEKEPEHRFRSASEFEAHIQAALSGKPEAMLTAAPARQPAGQPSRTRSYRPPVGRRPPHQKGKEPWVLLLTVTTFLLLTVVVQQCLELTAQMHRHQLRGAKAPHN